MIFLTVVKKKILESDRCPPCRVCGHTRALVVLDVFPTPYRRKSRSSCLLYDTSGTILLRIENPETVLGQCQSVD